MEGAEQIATRIFKGRFRIESIPKGEKATCLAGVAIFHAYLKEIAKFTVL
jgi:hypothetical protein